MRKFVRSWLDLSVDLKLVSIAQPFYLTGLVGGLLDWNPYPFFLGTGIGLTFGSLFLSIVKVYRPKKQQRMVVCKVCGWSGRTPYTNPNFAMIEQHNSRCPTCQTSVGHMVYGRRFALEYWRVDYTDVRWWKPWTWNRFTYMPPQDSVVNYISRDIDLDE